MAVTDPLIFTALGSFIFVEAAAFRQVGGFSLTLFAAEELELTQRLKVLAKTSRRKIVILHRHPMITSARKIHLYTPREHLRFLFRTILNRRRMLGNAQDAHLWYDGRR